jgi:DNA-binding IclR family transcriptional regulator
MPSAEPPRLGLRVSRGLALLELLAFGPQTAPASAAALGFDARTARRLLRGLAADRWVQPAGDRRWEPTLRLAAVAAQLLERSPLVRAAGPVLRGLGLRAGGPVELSVPSYGSVMTVLRADRGELLPLRRLAPAAGCAPGRVLLAHRPQWRASVLPDLGAELARRLEQVAHDGADAGDGRLAVPVAVGGETLAALSSEAGPDALPALRSGAAAIAAALAAR